MAIFDDSVTRPFRLPADELLAWRFLAAVELDNGLPEFMASRTRLALDIRDKTGPTPIRFAENVREEASVAASWGLVGKVHHRCRGPRSRLPCTSLSSPTGLTR